MQFNLSETSFYITEVKSTVLQLIGNFLNSKHNTGARIKYVRRVFSYRAKSGKMAERKD
jgi:hypothetical protein